MVLLLHEIRGVRERALALFAGKAQRAIGLRGEVVILLTTSRELRELNRRYRKKDEPTDVLSFPSEGGKTLGDIAISVQIAAASATELGHSAESELRILILHGLLHLAGYDHETDHGEMLSLETKLRQQFRLPTGLIERAHGGKPDVEQAPQRARAGTTVKKSDKQRKRSLAATGSDRDDLPSRRNGGSMHR